MKVDIFNTEKKYDIIYADPPRAYHDTLGGNAKMGEDTDRIELFARQYADGWDCWENEV